MARRHGRPLGGRQLPQRGIERLRRIGRHQAQGMPA
ncbi:Uncharacterised protein [Bordetella pertussis]|nr:Uncharacterised protein [Bordetella pertussis]